MIATFGPLLPRPPYPVHAEGGATAVKAQQYSQEACRIPGGRPPEVICSRCLAFRDSRGGALPPQELCGMPWGPVREHMIVVQCVQWVGGATSHGALGLVI